MVPKLPKSAAKIPQIPGRRDAKGRIPRIIGFVIIALVISFIALLVYTGLSVNTQIDPRDGAGIPQAWLCVVQVTIVVINVIYIRLFFHRMYMTYRGFANRSSRPNLKFPNVTNPTGSLGRFVRNLFRDKLPRPLPTERELNGEKQLDRKRVEQGMYPTYRILVPLRDETDDSIRSLVRNLARLSYDDKKLQILFLIDERAESEKHGASSTDQAAVPVELPWKPVTAVAYQAWFLVRGVLFRLFVYALSRLFKLVIYVIINVLVPIIYLFVARKAQQWLEKRLIRYVFGDSNMAYDEKLPENARTRLKHDLETKFGWRESREWRPLTWLGVLFFERQSLVERSRILRPPQWSAPMETDHNSTANSTVEDRDEVLLKKHLSALNSHPDKRLQSAHQRFRIVRVPRPHPDINLEPPKGKPRVLNYGLSYVWTHENNTGTEFNHQWMCDDFDAAILGFKHLVIYDAEDRPEHDQLLKAEEAFDSDKEQNIACFQAKLLYENFDDNWLITLFKADYSTWFNVMLPGICDTNRVVPLGGTSNHFRVSALVEAKGWDAYNVAEDCDLGVVLARNGHSVHMLRSVTWEQTSGDFRAWIRQRTRWIKGYMQTHIVHMSNFPALYKDLGYKKFMTLQLTLMNGWLLPIISPILWFITGAYVLALIFRLLFGSVTYFPFGTFLLQNFFNWFLPVTNYITAIQVWFLLPLFTSIMFFGTMIYFLQLIIGHLKNEKYGNIWWVIGFWWLYWLLMSYAAWKAAWEFIVNPYGWNKTSRTFMNK